MHDVIVLITIMLALIHFRLGSGVSSTSIVLHAGLFLQLPSGSNAAEL